MKFKQRDLIDAPMLLKRILDSGILRKSGISFIIVLANLRFDEFAYESLCSCNSLS